jgi:hypothetical protein
MGSRQIRNCICKKAVYYLEESITFSFDGKIKRLYIISQLGD